MTVAVVGEALDDFERDLRVDEIGGADLDGASASHEELESVGGGGDAAESDDGDRDGMGDLPYHTDGDRFDTGAAESASDSAEAGAPVFDIDSHAEEGVDEGDGVGASLFDSARDVDDAGDVRCKFDDEGLVVDLPDGGDDLSGHVGVGAEAHAAFFDIRAADVEFDGGDTVEGVDTLSDGAVFVDRRATDVDDDIGVETGDRGVDIGAEGVDADILETHGVEHA